MYSIDYLTQRGCLTWRAENAELEIM